MTRLHFPGIERARERVRLEWRICSAELDRLRRLHHAPMSIAGAASASALLVALGNGVVVAGRRWGHAEVITLISIPVIGLVGASLLHRRGWRWEDIGFCKLALEPPTGLPRGLVLVAVAITGGLGAAAMVTADDHVRLNIVRLLVGTAAGEEIIFRGVVLGAWTGTTVRGRWVLAVNMATFALWHVAGAFASGTFHWLHVAFPGIAASLLLWARLRCRSLIAPIAIHAGANMTEYRSRI